MPSEALATTMQTDVDIQHIEHKMVNINSNNRRYSLLPGRECLITSVDLNVKSPKDFMAALPYALEERLADPVETLHIVPAETTSLKRCACAHYFKRLYA